MVHAAGIQDRIAAHAVLMLARNGRVADNTLRTR
jgi:hypothetical protein